jgi:hypothetical protein
VKCERKILNELRAVKHDISVLNKRDIEAHKFIDSMKKTRR